MNKKIISIILATFSVVLIMLTVKPEKALASEPGFTVSAQIPDNQYDDSVSYFDLLMKPGQSQKLNITIENLLDAEKTFKVSPNSAYTASGVTEAYDKYNIDKYSTAKYKFSDIFSGPQTVTLKPYETKTVSLDVNMPTEKIEGILEGAINVVDINKGESKLTNQEDFGIRNQFSMAIGVILRESSTEHAVPKLKIRQVRASQRNFTRNPAILVSLENNQPAAIGKMTIKAKVSRTANSKALFTTEANNRSVAPNSKFDFAVPMGNQWINPGKYHLHLTATNGIDEWVFDREFDVSFTQAIELNRENRSFWWVWIVVIAVVIFIVILAFVYYLGYRRRASKINIEE
ncbi:cell surface protein [Companilactobacillus sp. RD055328]|uniref:DUF916 and DUF3324 domain-containing protein n=1 Tax=Companilactobacillus sp. RD055328 TaxID=2916634 RepID=UPI001FC845D1|nr:DUF916 and DUF3324 domain-containing protein [Companilactobacillus sp. RD055328]GKQ42203.1 cell surface protein [Companilactobacillus sp. RD055328]